MRRVLLALAVAALFCCGSGCMAIVSSKTMATANKRVVVMDGTMYVIDLCDNTARRVHMVEAQDITIEEIDTEEQEERTVD